MKLLLDRWRRGWLHQYFADMTPIDRAAALIGLLLALAIGLVFQALVRSREPSIGATPRLTAPPFELEFAAVKS